MRASNWLLIPLFLCIAQPSAAQVVLDNFEEGAFTLTLDPGEFLVFEFQDNLDPANVLSENREPQLFSFPLMHGGATLDLLTSGGDDALEFAATQPTGQGIDLIYQFAAPIDLDALGSSFSIELEALVDPGNDLEVRVFVEDSSFNESLVSFAPDTTGTIVLPFSALTPTGPQPTDLTSVGLISVGLTTTDGATDDVSATLDDFLVVPEPASTLLAGSALLTLLALRAGRRRAS